MKPGRIWKLRPDRYAALFSVLLHALVLVALLYHGRGAAGGYDAPAGTAYAGAAAVALPIWITPPDPDPPVLPPPELLTATQPMSPAVPALDALSGMDTTPIDIPPAPDHDSGVPPYIRYVGEVTARIQRAWAVPVTAHDLHCRVHLQLDSAGEVRSITLQACDVEPSLQASIRDAIHHAAPLPPRLGQDSAGDLTLEFAVMATATEGRRSSVQPSGAEL